MNKLILAVLLLAAANADAAIGFVQKAVAVSGGPYNQAAFASANTAGNLLVVVQAQQSDTASPTVSDTQGNTYASLSIKGTAGGSSAQEIYVYYAANCKGGANTVTTTANGSTGDYIAIYEFSGAASSNAAVIGVSSTVNNENGTPTTTPSSGSISPTAGSLLFGTIYNVTGELATVISAGSGFTLGYNQNNGGVAFTTEYKLSAASGSQTINFSSASEQFWILAGVEFKAAAVTAARVKPNVVNF